jgi:hypothetical protein
MAKEESVCAGSFFGGKKKGRVRMEKLERGPPGMKEETLTSKLN